MDLKTSSNAGDIEKSSSNSDEVQVGPDVDAVSAYTPAEDAGLLRRIDWIMMPIMCISYGIQFSDKTSLSYSSLFGIITDNHLVGADFSWLSTIFYLGYLFAELPANWLMQKFEIGRVLGIMMFCWGGLVMLVAACHNFTGLMIVRFLIGVFESSISPGFLLLVGKFYTTREQGTRVLVWASMNQGFASFAGVVTYFLGKNATDHPGSLAGWRTINLFLGSITCAWAIVVFLFLGSPDRVRWLSPPQKLHAKARVVSNKTNTHDVRTWNWSQCRECLVDPQVYFICAYVFLISMPNGGVTTFQSLILKGLGFDSLTSTLLGIPISVFSVLIYIVAILVNRRWSNIRLLLIAFFSVPPFCAFITLISLPPDSKKWEKYGVLFMGPLFAISIFLSFSLIPSNVAGRTKKSVVSTAVFIAYCAGNCVGPQAFQTASAPRYVPGLTTCIVCLGLNIALSGVWRQYYVIVNARRDAALLAEGLNQADREVYGKEAAEQDLTDLQNKYFRYTY